ncbi:hypothetical protein IV494_03160 [Kaistella sp. G5-32]|uniref:Uncharacterized protein n=1 Tax=Kaistella gelatinilytica TaxID=2787636 RepID=A0ABS0F8Y7_9FLAO|nr:hypothetical protein [Kaistella gelatinilytica]MBF8456171.1 hypothetical protein [Kaistella gelatinilytica]
MKNDYTFTNEYIHKNLEELWAIISIGLREKNILEISSIRGVNYKIEEVNNIVVSYSTPSRSSGKKEDLTKTDFLNFFKVLKSHSTFNTASIKLDLPTEIYAKRSPLFAVLLAMAIIKQTN